MKKIFTILGVSAAMIVSAQNLVQNPGFESGALSPWAKGPGNAYTEPTVANSGAHTGTYLAAYNGATATTGFYQDINITGGTEYSISFWYKATGDGTDARIWSVFKNSAGEILYLAGDNTTTSTGAQLDPLRGPYNLYLPESSTWTQHTLTFTAPSAAVAFQFAVRAYNNSTNASFDDFTLTTGSMATVDFSKDKHSLVKNTVVSDLLIFTKTADIKIYNTNGQVVKTASVKENSSLDISAFPKGVYIVTGADASQKIIKK